MAFKAEALIEKLGKLNATQQSIETTSQWCIFYRKVSNLSELNAFASPGLATCQCTIQSTSQYFKREGYSGTQHRADNHYKSVTTDLSLKAQDCPVYRGMLICGKTGHKHS